MRLNKIVLRPGETSAFLPRQNDKCECMTLQESFEPGFASAGEWAAMYRRAGLQVVPANMPKPNGEWKYPALTTWKTFQDDLVPQNTFEKWYGPNGDFSDRPNMGLLAGRCSQNLLVIDLDEYKTPDALAWWRGVLAVHNNGIEPETPQQITGGGGRQLYFRAPIEWRPPTNRTPIGVDIRGQGGFAMLPPSRHESGRSYEWSDGHAPWEIEIAEAQSWLMMAVDDLVEKHGGDKSSVRVAGEATASPAEDFNAFGTRIDGRDAYMRDIVWASITDWKSECKGAAPTAAESTSRMQDTFATYERKVKSRLPPTGGTNAELLEREGRGISLFTEKWRRAMGKWENEVAKAAANRPSESANPGAAPESAPRPTDKDGKPLPLLLTAAQFVAGFSPPQYLIDGIVQRGYLYALTARTGHGKTAVDMYIAQTVATGQKMHGKDTLQGTVLFLAGENPDDIRARFLVLADEYKFDVNKIKIKFVAGVIDIAASMPVIKTEAALIDDLVLVIVDTAAAYFNGDDTNNNSQQGNYARLLRQLTFLPGLPAVIVNCHPIKNASRDNLLPMGGSAFLNEIDGNLTLWANADRQTTMHWLGKFRGPEFEPVQFEMLTVESDKVIDADGRCMPSVVAKPVSEIKVQFAEAAQEREETTLLNFIAGNKNASISDMAIRCNFISAGGNPQKSKAYGMCQRLVEEKLLERRGPKYRITAKGKKEIGWGGEDD